MIRMIAAVRATVTAVALLAATPLLLVAVGGSPLPHRLPSAAQVQTWLQDPIRPQYMPATARSFAWLVWALTALLVLLVVWVRIRRWRWARLVAYLPGPVQGLAATVLGAAAATTAAGVLPAHAAAAVGIDTADPQHQHTANADPAGRPSPPGTVCTGSVVSRRLSRFAPATRCGTSPPTGSATRAAGHRSTGSTTAASRPIGCTAATTSNAAGC
ncbi:hypothetical protein [Paractinoplanes durhamensis]|uniref:hypothetical protein n=1 Tax=Paractinoplanes durhamensis TaxID=113563 RepID=UPI00363476ED